MWIIGSLSKIPFTLFHELMYVFYSSCSFAFSFSFDMYELVRCVCVYVVGLIVCIKTYAYAFHSTNPLVCCAVIPYSALIYKCRLFHAKYTFRMGRYVFVIYRFLLWNTTFYLYELMWVCVCLNMRFVCISNMKLINDFIETWRIKVALPFMQLQSFWSVTCNVVSFHILVSFLFVSLPESVHVWNVISAK